MLQTELSVPIVPPLTSIIAEAGSAILKSITPVAVQAIAFLRNVFLKIARYLERNMPSAFLDILNNFDTPLFKN